MNITVINILIAFIGWLGWNIIIFRIDKDRYDDLNQEFPFREYIKKSYDNWLSTLIGVPIILVGAELLDIIRIFHDTEVTWSNAFYLGAGVVIEVPMYFIKRDLKK